MRLGMMVGYSGSTISLPMAMITQIAAQIAGSAKRTRLLPNRRLTAASTLRELQE